VKHSRRFSRMPPNLSNSVDLRLNMYALAASAAGVGALALAQPSEAEIVYTPAHVTVGINKTIPLDLNHDGKADFRLQNVWGTAEGTGVGALNALPRPTVEPGRGIWDVPFPASLRLRAQGWKSGWTHLAIRFWKVYLPAQRKCDHGMPRFLG
jgi:hypothetical protein